jgi:hypothetical protein
MKLEHAIKTLEKELAELHKPIEEEDDDIYKAVLSCRQETDIKEALKILKEYLENSKLIGI